MGISLPGVTGEGSSARKKRAMIVRWLKTTFNSLSCHKVKLVKEDPCNFDAVCGTITSWLE